MTLAEFAAHVIAICVTHRASCTSWYRTPARNLAVGGKPTSRHLDGYAVDLVADDPLDDALLVNDAHARGLRALRESNHVHLEAPRVPT